MQIEINRLRRLRKGKNSVEIGRIDIMIESLMGAKYKEIIERFKTTKDRIALVRKRYKEDRDNFFKTNYKGAKEQITKETTDKIISYIKKQQEKNKGVDLYGILDLLGLERNEKNYNKIWYITRRKLKLNYQKPYIKDKKSPDNAQEILKKKYRGKLKVK